jgi:hypothetical protein
MNQLQWEATGYPQKRGHFVTVCREEMVPHHLLIQETHGVLPVLSLWLMAEGIPYFELIAVTLGVLIQVVIEQYIVDSIIRVDHRNLSGIAVEVENSVDHLPVGCKT